MYVSELAQIKVGPGGMSGSKLSAFSVDLLDKTVYLSLLRVI